MNKKLEFKKDSKTKATSRRSTFVAKMAQRDYRVVIVQSASRKKRLIRKRVEETDGQKVADALRFLRDGFMEARGASRNEK
jgi:hypothetical protein